MPGNQSKLSDVEALFFVLVSLTAVLIFCNRLEEAARVHTRAGIAALAGIAIAVFVWRKFRAW
jgi:hypothetical protein